MMVFPRNLAMTRVVKGCYDINATKLNSIYCNTLQHQIEFLTTTYHLCRILVFVLDSKGERNVIITIYNNNNKTVRAFMYCIYK